MKQQQESEKSTLNDMQKGILRGIINQRISMAQIECREPYAFRNYELKDILEAIINGTLSKEMRKSPLWKGLEFLALIIQHPAPQNMSDNDYSIEIPEDSDKVSYTNIRGEPVVEAKGLLDLASLNDKGTNLSKKETVEYVKSLIFEKIEIQKKRISCLANNKFIPFWNGMDRSLDIQKLQPAWMNFLLDFINHREGIRHFGNKFYYPSHNTEKDYQILEQMFHNMPDLHSLALTNLVTDIRITQYIKKFPRLNHLKLSGYFLDKEWKLVSANLEHLKHLQSLSITGDCFNYWLYEQMVRDEVAKLHTVVASEDGIIALANIVKNNPGLSFLRLKANACFGDIGMQHISEALAGKPLKLLEIYGGRISDKGALDIASLIANSSIKTLIIHASLMGNKGMLAIAKAIAANPVCVNVSIFGHYINNDGLLELARILDRHPGLQSFNLCGGYLGSTDRHPQATEEVQIFGSLLNIDSITIRNHYSEKPFPLEKNPQERLATGRKHGINTWHFPTLQSLSLFVLDKKQGDSTRKSSDFQDQSSVSVKKRNY